MKRQHQRAVNQLRHLSETAYRLYERVEEMCPVEFRPGQRIDEADVMADEWQNAHAAALALAEATASLVLHLDPAEASLEIG